MPLNVNDINTDTILPYTTSAISVGGLIIKKANDTVYLGSTLTPPTGTNSVIIGHGAGGGLTSSDNVAIGRLAMFGATTSASTVSIGSSAGASLTTGNANTFIGSTSGQNVTTGFGNTCVGQQAGASFGANAITNTFIGNQTGTNVSNISGQGNTCLGHGANPSSALVNHEITLGSVSILALRCAVTSITSLSDARDKKDIAELSAGLDFVKELNPVSFVWDDRDEDGKHDVKDFGFIAQDLKATQEKYDMAETLGLVYEENPEKLEASYGKLIPILVKAIKELSSKVEALESKKK
jgi:hypothetical protein